jgi:hypothetical protein
MSVEFSTPIGGLLAIGALVVVGALRRVELRAAHARAELRLEPPRRVWSALEWAALASVPIVLGVAAMQPVVLTKHEHHVRTDAEAFYIFDTSRSMLAASSPEARTRMEQALRTAHTLKAALHDIPTGIATMTDRVLPNVFPSTDDRVVLAGLDETVAVQNPPARGTGELGTFFGALDTLAGDTFFSSHAARRLAVLFTDGESRPFDDAQLRESLARGVRTRFVIVKVGRRGDMIWTHGKPETAYQGGSGEADGIQALARATSGRSFTDGEIPGIIAASRQFLGSGPTRTEGLTVRIVPLARWIALVAMVPLAFVLARWATGR